MRMAAWVAPILFVAVPIEAYAQSCDALRSQLARASSGGGASGQIAQLEKQARASGCRSQGTFGRSRMCIDIDVRISRLRSGSGGDPRRVRQLQRQIANNCGSGVREARAPRRAERRAVVVERRAAAQPVRAPASGVIIHGTRPDNGLDQRTRRGGGGGFFANLFGTFEPAPYRARPGLDRIVPEDVYREERRREIARRQKEPAEVRVKETDPDAEAAREARQAWSPNAPRGSNFKTWCVRLCDGFYFPVSENASSSGFPQDLAMCVNQCPAADVSLYAHKRNAPPEQMISAITGEPYVDLPTAFSYRKTFNPNCGCGAGRTPEEVLEAGERSSPSDDRESIEIAGFSASTSGSSLPDGVARVKSLIEPSGSRAVAEAASETTAYVNRSGDSLGGGSALAAAEAQASGDSGTLAAIATDRDAGSGTDTQVTALGVRESAVAAAVQPESGDPMPLMSGAAQSDGTSIGSAPPTDVSSSLRFRMVGPSFYASQTVPLSDPADAHSDAHADTAE